MTEVIDLTRDNARYRMEIDKDADTFSLTKWVDGEEVKSLSGSLSDRIAETRLFDQCLTGMETIRGYMTP